MNISKFFTKKILILFAILVLASALRFYKLGTVPSSPDWDEAALGYNAYSILHTGRDEYGKFLPVILRSFDDYKPALYAYLVIPVLMFTKLSVWAVRFPSAVIGVFTVLGTYFLVRELFKNEKLGLLASFLLAISPWHIQFSHTAFEASVGVFFNVFTAIFFLKGLKKPWLLFLSVLFSVASIYVYQSEKVFAPLFFLLLVIIYRKELFALPKKLIVGGVVFGIILLFPVIAFTLTNSAVFARAQGVSFLSDTSSILKTDSVRLLNDRNTHDFIGLVYDNRRLVFLKQIIANYISHFDLNWLFITGDIPRHHAPGMGILYIWELPFILIGLYQLLFGAYSTKAKILLFSWFLIVPIPAAVTTGVPHAIRTLNFLPLHQIFTAIGIMWAFTRVSSFSYKVVRIPIKYPIFLISSLVFLFIVSYYLDQYFIQQNYYNSREWQYGYEPAVQTVSQIENKYDKIVVSTDDYFDQSYIFFLFYLSYSPREYQAYSQYASGGFREDHAFGKYEFRSIHWSTEEKSPKILYIGRPSDFPTGVTIIKSVNFLDGTPDMSIVKG